MVRVGQSELQRNSTEYQTVCARVDQGWELHDPYMVLGVDRGATEGQIKTAYRSGNRLLHTDIAKTYEHDGDGSIDKIAERLYRFQNAYYFLTNNSALDTRAATHYKPRDDDGQLSSDAFRDMSRPKSPAHLSIEQTLNLLNSGKHRELSATAMTEQVIKDRSVQAAAVGLVGRLLQQQIVTLSQGIDNINIAARVITTFLLDVNSPKDVTRAVADAIIAHFRIERNDFALEIAKASKYWKDVIGDTEVQKAACDRFRVLLMRKPDTNIDYALNTVHNFYHIFQLSVHSLDLTTRVIAGAVAYHMVGVHSKYALGIAKRWNDLQGIKEDPAVQDAALEYINLVLKAHRDSSLNKESDLNAAVAIRDFFKLREYSASRLTEIVRQALRIHSRDNLMEMLISSRFN